MAITLSELGETPDVAERLLALFQRIGVTASPAGAELPRLSDALFEALWHVTRRTGLLVVEQPRGSRRYVLRPRRGSTAPTVSPLSRGSGQTGRARGETSE
ncbi:hypothetical protein [Thermogemmatispora sp.]|uniref:hypothetical protein n=1 Tax=Thermogemmatispora sp. TaxID=1968838 RepID=UPI0035E407C0